MDSRLLEPPNAPFEIILSPLKISVFNPVLPLNIPPAVKSTSPSKVIFSSAVFPAKMEGPRVEPSGKVNSLSFKHPENTPPPMDVFLPKIIVSMLIAP